MVKATRVSAPAPALANPAAIVRRGGVSESVRLATMACAAQPTEYTREAWARRSYSRITRA